MAADGIVCPLCGGVPVNVAADYDPLKDRGGFDTATYAAFSAKCGAGHWWLEDQSYDATGAPVGERHKIPFSPGEAFEDLAVKVAGAYGLLEKA